jgi:hypothetical protein
MRNRKKWLPIVLGAGTVLLGCAVLLVAKPDKDKVEANDLKPKWSVGDQWVVETQNQQMQSRVDLTDTDKDKDKDKTDRPDKDIKLPPVQWQFTVAKEEELGKAKCLRVDVKCLVEGKQPITTIWVDPKSMTIRQYETQLHVQGRYRTVKESYQLQDGQPTPILCPGNALPLDMPLFRKGEAKGEDTFYYEAVMGELGTKDPGDVGFLTEVKQTMKSLKPDDVKGLIADDFSKDLESKPVVEVELTTPDKRTVRQLWRQEMPWPVYVDNGATQARLIKYTPAKKN